MKNVQKLNIYQLREIADEYQTSAVLLRALYKAEMNGNSGFLENGRAVISFEGDIFWRELRRLGYNPHAYANKYPNIVCQDLDESNHREGNAEYLRLSMAISINKNAALRSTSWGMFNIMGFNYSLCNEATIEGFVEKMNIDEASQLRLNLNLIKNANMMPLLKNHMFQEFAMAYKAKGEKGEIFAEKLSYYYNEFSKK